MDLDTFTRLCKDCNFYNENFNAEEAALLFARVVPKSRSLMNAEEFDFVLNQIAQRRLQSLHAFARSYSALVFDGVYILAPVWPVTAISLKGFPYPLTPRCWISSFGPSRSGRGCCCSRIPDGRS